MRNYGICYDTGTTVGGSAQNAVGYRDQLRGYHRRGKPVAVSEFGCCTTAGRGVRCHAAWVGHAARSACRVPAVT